MPRLDVFLHNSGFFRSRQRARVAILDGCITVNSKSVTKPGTPVTDSDKIDVVPMTGEPYRCHADVTPKTGEAPQCHTDRSGYDCGTGGHNSDSSSSSSSSSSSNDSSVTIGSRSDVGTGGCSHMREYVSRGGLKLEHALTHFNIDVTGMVAVDIGASTGGFTDCMLSFGAKKVYSVDVGHGQMDPGLAGNENVVLMEGINAKLLKPGEIADGKVDIGVIDVSFISLTKVLLPVSAQLKENADIICLVKPQFEVGRTNIGKKGIVKDNSQRISALEKIKSFAVTINLIPVADTISPITGGDGNVEFLLHLRKVASQRPGSTDFL